MADSKEIKRVLLGPLFDYLVVQANIKRRKARGE